MKVVVVGAGIFGATAALALRRRGHDVSLVDPGPLPHPDAASTDVSKVIRADYGSDVFYTQLMEQALPRWRSDPILSRYFHETGLAILSAAPLVAGSFELESHATLTARGHQLELLDAERIAARFPAWRPGRFQAGYYNPQGGWAESGAATLAVAEAALAAGVTHVPRAARAIAAGARAGVQLSDDSALTADRIVVAAGAWTRALLPELADRLVALGQPVTFFRAAAPDLLSPPRFVPFTADVALTGLYGLPCNAEGLVKIAHHGEGVPLDTASPNPSSRSADGVEAFFRAFLRDSLPALATAPLERTRLCLYSDSFDGDLFICPHPARDGVVVASGGSGHAFKLAPVLGDLIADVVEGQPPRERFAWRAVGARRREAARSLDELRRDEMRGSE